ncbi:MAG: DUF5615 family PIN-like protein [Spirulina sp.]
MDEDCQDKRLIRLLRNVNHDVITVNEAKLMGQPDPVILDYARTENRLVLTFNCDDYQELHQINSSHPGILGVYQEANFSKNMTYREIVRAIANLETANIPLTGQFIALNLWKY